MTLDGCPAPLAFVVSLVLSWQHVGVEDAIRLIWKRVAYACRYGKGVGLNEALDLDTGALSGFLEALGTLVAEENKANRS